MSCPNCGASVPDQATHCPSCGAPLQTAGAPTENAPWGAPPPPAYPPQGNPPPPGDWTQSAPPPPPGDWTQTAPGAGSPPWGPPPGSGTQAWGGAGGGPSATAGQLAGWWRRVGATIIDIIILGVISTIIGLAIGKAGQYVVEVVLGLVYTGYLISARGQTVGMMAVGTKCIRESDGQNLAIGPAIGRWAIAELLDITVIGGLLDVLWPLWDKKNQTIHDKVVHTVVVRTK